MPTDLSVPAQRPVIQVRDRAGVGLPFSKGLMASSILATGLHTDHAYRIAARIERVLHGRAGSEVEADELAEIAADALRELAGEEFSKRYRAWRRAKRAGFPVVVCLGGASGVGKSTVATRLALRLGVNRVVTTDAIREVLRTVIPPTVVPELHVSTYESVDRDESLTGQLETYLRQARAVSAATGAVVSRLATEGRNVIVEGVHVLPGEVRRALEERNPEAIVVELLLTLDDEEIHRAHLTRRCRSEPGRDGRRGLERFAAIRRLQEELRDLARQSGVAEYDIAHPEELTQCIVDQVVERTAERVRLASVMS